MSRFLLACGRGAPQRRPRSRRAVTGRLRWGRGPGVGQSGDRAPLWQPGLPATSATKLPPAFRAGLRTA